jgi:hypothetical protein
MTYLCKQKMSSPRWAFLQICFMIKPVLEKLAEILYSCSSHKPFILESAFSCDTVPLKAILHIHKMYKVGFEHALLRKYSFLKIKC